MPISPRNAEFTSSMASGLGASNPMSGGSMDGYDRGGGTGRDKLTSTGVHGKSMAGVGSANISGVGKMPTLPTIKPGDIPAKAPKAPKLPTNPSMGRGAGMRPGGFQIGSGGGMLRID